MSPIITTRVAEIYIFLKDMLLVHIVITMKPNVNVLCTIKLECRYSSKFAIHYYINRSCYGHHITMLMNNMSMSNVL